MRGKIWHEYLMSLQLQFPWQLFGSMCPNAKRHVKLRSLPYFPQRFKSVADILRISEHFMILLHTNIESMNLDS